MIKYLYNILYMLVIFIGMILAYFIGAVVFVAIVYVFSIASLHFFGGMGSFIFWGLVFIGALLYGIFYT